MRLDFAAKRRALAVGYGRNARRVCTTACSQRGELRQLIESAARKVLGNGGKIVVAVRNSSQEAWRIDGKRSLERLGHDIRELVLVNPIPHIEHEEAAGTKHTS